MMLCSRHGKGQKKAHESHDEYMSEEHIGQESHGKNKVPSELHPSAIGDQVDSDGDIEVNFHGKNLL